MNFANSPVFRIGGLGRFTFGSKMPLSDEFSLASPHPIYRLFAFRRTHKQHQILQRLNEAHPKLNSDTFLGWRLDSGSKGVR